MRHTVERMMRTAKQHPSKRPQPHERLLFLLALPVLVASTVSSPRGVGQYGARKLKTSSCFDFMMQDDWGDGWDGAKYIFRDASTLVVVASGTLQTGFQGTDEICLDAGCYTFGMTSGYYPSEINWGFGGIEGGLPYRPSTSYEYSYSYHTTSYSFSYDTASASSDSYSYSSYWFGGIEGGLPYRPSTSYEYSYPYHTTLYSFSYDTASASSDSYSYSSYSYSYEVDFAESQLLGIAITAEGAIEFWDSACPTPAPTTATFLPTVTPAPTPTPTTSSGPTTFSPTSAPVEVNVQTLSQLSSAISQAAASGADLVAELLADITVTDPLNIKNDQHVTIKSRAGVGLNGGGVTQLFLIAYRGKLSVQNVTVSDGAALGDAGGGGGAIFSLGGTVELDKCTMTTNTAKDDGGAILNYGGTVIALNSVMKGNSARFAGAAVNLNGGRMLFKDCTLSANTGSVDAGVVWNAFYAEVDFDGCFLTLNRAFEWGGAVTNYGTAHLNNCTISYNAAVQRSDAWVLGGALYNSDSMDLTECTLTANRVSGSDDGGAIYNTGTLNLNECLLTANSVLGNGGAIVNTGAIAATACTFASNTAGIGGAVHAASPSAKVELKDCDLTSNSATRGGAVALESGATATFERCSFSGVYEDDACLLDSDGESKLEFYYQRDAFESGLVCSISTALVYNASVSIPFVGSSGPATMTCDSSGVSGYCTYDCSNKNVGGIVCRYVHTTVCQAPMYDPPSTL